jgi:hypothetical protein
MTPPRRLAALCLPALLAFPATADATPFKDRVFKRGATARAAQAQGTTQMYPTPDGYLIPITLASTYTGDPAVAQRFATLLGSLPHGPEIAALRVTVVPPEQIEQACGGWPGSGILACYGADDQTMIVPADQVPGSTVPIEYVITHEYGHHIAANRSHAPLAALDFGPKRWSSYELVCKQTADGKLSPGDQGESYFQNPGEAWAEAYARLVFPDAGWRFTRLLEPVHGSLLAAMADVSDPWLRRTSTTFTGKGTRTFKLPLRLDGAFTLKLTGPARANYDLVLRSGGKVIDRTTRRGSRDRLHYPIACRDRRTETLRITVVRRSGKGGYTLKASYAG